MNRDPHVLDVLGAYHGPCAFCGDEDARHRVADAIVERVSAGDSAPSVADDYGLDDAAVAFLIEHWPAGVVVGTDPQAPEISDKC